MCPGGWVSLSACRCVAPWVRRLRPEGRYRRIARGIDRRRGRHCPRGRKHWPGRDVNGCRRTMAVRRVHDPGAVLARAAVVGGATVVGRVRWHLYGVATTMYHHGRAVISLSQPARDGGTAAKQQRQGCNEDGSLGHVDSFLGRWSGLDGYDDRKSRMSGARGHTRRAIVPSMTAP